MKLERLNEILVSMQRVSMRLRLWLHNVYVLKFAVCIRIKASAISITSLKLGIKQIKMSLGMLQESQE